ncbi:MAG: L-seryl-tRNA(Sec) selenium transferase [Fidelibacterota bacterium]
MSQIDKYKEELSKIPSVDEIIAEIHTSGLNLPRSLIVKSIREELEIIRRGVVGGKAVLPEERVGLISEVANSVEEKLRRRFCPSLKRVINGTGVILHTGLGRAPLSASAAESVKRVLTRYSNLEIDLETGERGDRGDHVEDLICSLTGAESALMVNNNAAAVFLVLNTLSWGKETIISRGQLVEIGGSFRIPEIMAKSGALMIEVGTTNRTHLYDYKNALGDRTAAIMWVHTSNFRVIGFTSEVELGELVKLGKNSRLPVICDLGSGALIDTREFGLPCEPLVSQIVKKGADVISFSGDKLLGGPQAGIIVGARKYIELIKENPITRAVRCDKLTYSAMEETLRLFSDKEQALSKNPVYKMITASERSLRRKAEKIVKFVGAENRAALDQIKVEKSFAETGSGSLPAVQIPSLALRITPKGFSPHKFSYLMRKGISPVIGYIRNDSFYIDMRTVFNDEVETVARRISEVLKEGT